MKLVAFCEAAPDFAITECLVRRTVVERGPQWVRDMVEANPSDLLAWGTPDTPDERFFRWKNLTHHALQLEARPPHGAFDGGRGPADAMSALTALYLVRRLVQRGVCVDGVVLLRDADNQPDRREGLTAARERAEGLLAAAVVIGLANPKREAWVLAGFDPTSDDERSRFDECRRKLGFDPTTEAHRLTASAKGAKKSAKDVLDVLTGGQREREEKCYEGTSLDVLAERGVASGLTAFLCEIKDRIVPRL